MSALHLRVRHGAGEPAYALFRRLAARNAFTSIRAFGDFTGLRYGDILRGRDLERLAELNNSSVDDLRRWTPFKVEDCWTLNGHRLRPRSWRPERAAYCAECLIAGIGEVPDGVTARHAALLRGAHRRVWWDLTFTDCCPLHLSLLVRACRCGRGITSGDALARQCPWGCDRASTSGAPISAELSLPDVYVLGRLGALPAPAPIPVLDSLPIDLAGEFMEQIGAALTGDSSNTGPLAGQFRCELRLAGLRWLQTAASESPITFPDKVRRRLDAWRSGKALGTFYDELIPPRPRRIPRREQGRHNEIEAAALAGLGVSAFLQTCYLEKMPAVQPGRWSDDQVQRIRHLARPELLLSLPGSGLIPDRALEPLPRPRVSSRRRQS